MTRSSRFQQFLGGFPSECGDLTAAVLGRTSTDPDVREKIVFNRGL